MGIATALLGGPWQRPEMVRRTAAALGSARAPRWVGTLVGQSFVNDTVSVAFLALAAGSILYVIVQLLRVAQRLGHRTRRHAAGSAAQPPPSSSVNAWLFPPKAPRTNR